MEFPNGLRDRGVGGCRGVARHGVGRHAGLIPGGQIPVALSLPNDYDSLHECYSYGKLLPESSHVAAAIRSVAAMMTGEHIEPKNIVVRFFQKWTRPCQCRDKTPAVLPVLPICGDVNLGGMR